MMLKKQKPQSNVEISRQLGSQYIQIFKMLEKMKELNEKIEENQKLLKNLDKKYTKLKERRVKSISLKTKTKEAIKLILKKQGRMTSNQLKKFIGLSRTRCNEYLRNLEKCGDATSEIIKRKKYYRLKS